MFSGKRTLYNAFHGRDEAWDPFGVAKFDLSGLILGQKVLYLSSPILQCPILDVLGLRLDEHSGKLIGIEGAVDGPSTGEFANILHDL